MKLLKALFIILFIFTSCEKPSNCIQSSGITVTKDVAVTPFSRIEVFRGIAVVITQGDTYKVQVKTGENILPDVIVTQNNSILSLKTNTSCNWVRDFGETTVYITAPNIEEIYSKTEKNISSNGILNYPILRLFSLDQDADGIPGAGTGDFILQINNNQLVIENNNVSRYFISGSTNEALLNLYSGDGRIDAQNLTAQNINVFHRGSNDMIVKPIQSISGKIVSTGNIVLKNNPPIINVQQLYQGQLIYN